MAVRFGEAVAFHVYFIKSFQGYLLELVDFFVDRLSVFLFYYVRVWDRLLQPNNRVLQVNNQLGLVSKKNMFYGLYQDPYGLQFLNLRLFSVQLYNDHFLPKFQQSYVSIFVIFLIQILQIFSKHSQKLFFHQKISHSLNKPIMTSSRKQHMINFLTDHRLYNRNPQYK